MLGKVGHETWPKLQIKFHFYESALIGGGAELMGRDLGTRPMEKCFFAPLSSGQEYGGWTRPGGIMVMSFYLCWPLGGDLPACHPQIKCPTHN